MDSYLTQEPTEGHSSIDRVTHLGFFAMVGFIPKVGGAGIH